MTIGMKICNEHTSFIFTFLNNREIILKMIFLDTVLMMALVETVLQTNRQCQLEAQLLSLRSEVVIGAQLQLHSTSITQKPKISTL
jgi:hypothetical protein